jgi:hypothetical protein
MSHLNLNPATIYDMIVRPTEVQRYCTRFKQIKISIFPPLTRENPNQPGRLTNIVSLIGMGLIRFRHKVGHLRFFRVACVLFFPPFPTCCFFPATASIRGSFLEEERGANTWHTCGDGICGFMTYATESST